MPAQQRRRTIREENDFFLLNRGIVPQEVGAVPIAFNIATGANGAHNATTGLQGGASPDDYYHLTLAQHDSLTDGSDAQLLHTHEFYQRYAFYT